MNSKIKKTLELHLWHALVAGFYIACVASAMALKNKADNQSWWADAQVPLYNEQSGLYELKNQEKHNEEVRRFVKENGARVDKMRKELVENQKQRTRY